MTPDELRTRSFTVAMRGYERAEVDRVVSEAASDLERLRARVEELEQRLAAVPDESSGGDPMDKYRSLGEQTTAILVQAETAARELREEAEAEAARLRAEATAHAQQVTGEADEHARSVRAEADAHARQVRDDADAEARETVEEASRRAASEVAAAERAARERVETASAHARRIVEDAEARRDEAEAERARVDAARAALVAGLRAAVDAVGSEVDLLEETPGPAPTDGPTTRDRTAGGADAPGTGRPTLDVVDDEASPLPESLGGERPSDDAAGEGSPTAADRDGSADPVPGDAERAGGTTAAPGAPGPAEAEVDAAGATDTADVAPTPDATPGADASGEGSGAGDEGAPAPAPAAAPSPVAVVITDAAVAAGREEPVATDEPIAPSMLRERSLAAVRPGMLRRLRRGLQELQNGALESLRERGRDADADALLPAAEVAEPLVEVARAFLDAAYRAGAGDAPVLRGDDPHTDAEADPTVVEDAAAALAGALVHELRTTLRPSLAAGLDADEADASLSERVGEVFRDLKGPVVEGLVDEHLTRVYGTATSAAWAAGGVEQVRWVLGEEARCPEGACRGNAGEDPQPVGGAFPSGHAVPPVHEGCTCALVPA